MKAKQLKEKYPVVWDYVYNNILDDLLSFMPGVDIEQCEQGNKHSRIYRIAHNAAFLACNIHHKQLKEK